MHACMVSCWGTVDGVVQSCSCCVVAQRKLQQIADLRVLCGSSGWGSSALCTHQCYRHAQDCCSLNCLLEEGYNG